jgi:hypothetical protein
MKVKLALLNLFAVVLAASNSGFAQTASGKPAIFVCGDSTAKNSGKGKNG